MTTPDSLSVQLISGIIRDRTAITLAEKVLGIPVEERRIDRTELFISDEVFFTGTAAQITAVTKVDHRPIGTGKMGPVADQLRSLFDDVVRGCNPEFMEWLRPVY